ncbi:MAG TPA: hypothetical protein PK402_11405, partial [Tepidisphaeraceae bacterium]|nr:hypothetical protein [Tepidisphaeraceae bacterium]
GATVEAGLLKTVADGRGVILEPINDQTPIVVRSTSPEGKTELTARRIDADSKTGLATLIGPAKFSNTDAQNQTTALSWTGDGHMTEPSPGKRLLTLSDNVELTHPTLGMKATTLAIGFDEVKSNGASIGFDPKSMRTMTAKGNVTVISEQADLSAGTVTVNMNHKDGVQTIASLDASESVNFIQREADQLRLNADTMNVQFDETAQVKSTNNELPVGQMKSMRATGAVKVTAQRDGTPLEAIGEMLEMKTVDANNILTVHGAPALLTTSDGTIQANSIDLNESEKSIRVAGPGTLSVTDAKTNQKLDLSWNNSFNASQATNQLNADGEVLVRSMVNNQQLEATADRLTGVLEDQTKSKGGLKSLRLEQQVILNLSAPNEPSMRLESTQMDVDVEPMRVRVPVGGRMLVERFQLEKSESNKLANAAIVWNDSLNWDGASGNATILGNVKVGIEQGDSNSPTRVFCDRIDAQLTPVTKAVDQSNAIENIELKSLAASGNVRVRGDKASFDAGQLAFDATTNLAQAIANEGRSVEVYDPSGEATVSFSGLSWNVQTGLIESVSDID